MLVLSNLGSSIKVWKYILISLIINALLSCTAEQMKELKDQINAGDKVDGKSIDGTYALDDGSGLSGEYLSFFKGTLSHYRGVKGVLAEGFLWDTSSNTFSLKDMGEYQISNGVLYLKNQPLGEISFSDGTMTLAGQKYTQFFGFKSEHYSVISVGGDLECTCDYDQQTLTIPVSLKTIPSFSLDCFSSEKWAIGGGWKDGLLTVKVSLNFGKSRTTNLTLSYLYAEPVTITLVQSGFPEEYQTDPTAANCYLISSPGTLQFKAVYGKTTAPIKNIASVGVLWESFGTSTPPAKGDIIQSVSYSPGSNSSVGTISVSTPSVLKNGNAVIAAKDASGRILWSWHIWVCKDYDPVATAQTNYYDNLTNLTLTMDRNLGATSATPGDVGALGLQYILGRKDPFPGSSNIKTKVRAVTTPDVSWFMSVDDFASAHPTAWSARLTDDFEDPCPPGWSVPYADRNFNATDYTPYGDYFYYTDKMKYDIQNEGICISGLEGSAATIWYPSLYGYLGKSSFFFLEKDYCIDIFYFDHVYHPDLDSRIGVIRCCCDM